MKKILALFAALALLCSLCPAVAEDAQFASTRAFIAALDAGEFIYTYDGISENGNEALTVPFENDENGLCCEVSIFFDPNEENCYMYIWNIVAFDEAMLADALFAVNACNANTQYVKFYADLSDNTVTAEQLVIFRSNDMADICMEAMQCMVLTVDSVYTDTLLPLAK